MASTTDRDTLGLHAQRCADQRRKTLALWSGEDGSAFALDLMGYTEGTPTPAELAFAHLAAEAQATALKNATLYLADPDMVDLLDAAANTMPDQQLLDTDIISPSGFLYFASPLPDKSGEPPEIPLRTLTWTRLPPGHPITRERTNQESVLITAYIRALDYIATLPETLQRQSQGLIPDNKIAPNATVVWTLGSLIGEVFGAIPDEPTATPGFYQRVIAAFWTLAQQPKLTTTHDLPQGKPTDQRRYRRAGITNPHAPVHLVQLHRTQNRRPGIPGEPTGRHLTVRFGVRGHWRNQWLPSTKTHRVQWIDPYIKGPEDAPLMGGERVFRPKT